jgi:hypothetical protein
MIEKKKGYVPISQNRETDQHICKQVVNCRAKFAALSTNQDVRIPTQATVYESKHRIVVDYFIYLFILLVFLKNRNELK